MGLKLFESGDYQGALQLFDKSLGLPGTGIKRFRDKPPQISDGEKQAAYFNIACCQSKLGNIKDGLGIQTLHSCATTPTWRRCVLTHGLRGSWRGLRKSDRGWARSLRGFCRRVQFVCKHTHAGVSLVYTSHTAAAASSCVCMMAAFNTMHHPTRMLPRSRTVTCNAITTVPISVKGLQNGNPDTLTAKLSQLPGVQNVCIEDGNIVRVTADACDASTVATLMNTIRTLVRILHVHHLAWHIGTSPQDTRYRPFPYIERSWHWRDHKVNYAEAGTVGAPPIIMVHGFGASVGHFRKLAQQLALDYHVFAIDLLGFGASDKPPTETYNPSLWQAQVTDFIASVVGRPAVLVGNSIGSQVVAAVAAASPQSVAALCLLNCTGAMNARGLYRDDPRLLLLMPVFAAFEAALKVPAIATMIFSNFRSRQRVASLLTSPSAAVYANREAVDDELLDILIEPAADPGAQNVFVQVFTGDPGQRPEASMARVTCPVQVQWGEADPWTPIDGTVAQHFKALAAAAPARVEFVQLPDTGHCPQDDRPELVLEAMLPWLQRVV